MRKKIGVFMGEVLAEYQSKLLRHIFREAKAKNYDVMVFANFGAYGDNVLYAEGEKSVITLPDISMLDGIIVSEDTFDIVGMANELEELLMEKAKCPVVYLKDYKEQFYSVLLEDMRIMEDITRHFVEHHGFRDICFVTGKKSYVDAQNRYKGFLNVMEEAGIAVTEHMVFEGDYWRRQGKEIVDWFMEGRSTYPQAIICSNDYEAFGVCQELRKRNIRVPEDICVSGYDNLKEAQIHQPSLTTGEVPVERMAVRAVDIIDNVNSGKPQEKVEWVRSDLVLGRSCGCGEQEVVENPVWMLERMYVLYHDMKQVVFMTTDCQDLFEEKEIFRIADKYISTVDCKKLWLCLCDETENCEEEGNYYSDKMILRRVYAGRGRAEKCRKEFLRRDLLPVEYFETDEPEAYFIFGVHYKNKCFGYINMTVDDEKWVNAYTQAYTMILANALEDGLVHQEVSNLEEIRKLYLSDPLTGIYNRRGFEKQLRLLYEKRKSDPRYLSIVSIDMDGLKSINDTYGHPEGDAALRRFADVLKRLVKEGEVCARTGGDEFAVVLAAESRDRYLEFERNFKREMEDEAKRVPKPYLFHASMGTCCISEEQNLSLMACMQLADKRMYQQKKRSKMTREDLLKKNQ